MMDERLRKFIEETAQSIVGLNVVLFFQANPKTFDTASGLALRLREDIADIEPTLARLVDHGILEVHMRGGGQYRCYALAGDQRVWNLLCLVTEAYVDDPHTCKEIVQMLVSQHKCSRDVAPPTTEEH